MFNTNWTSLVTNNTPMEWVKATRIAWLKVIVSQIKAIHTSFIQYRSDALYKLSFNGQIMNLKHVLNDKFDSAGRGIYIDNIADLNRIYLYNKSEGRDPFYFYNNYDASVTYAIGEFSVRDNKVWVANSITIGNVPSSTSVYWTYHKDVVFFKNLSEYLTLYEFIVMVPVAVVFDINEMKALVNYYKAAGKRYTIQTY